MASKLRIPSPLRRFTEGESIIDVSGGTVKETLDELFRKFPDIQKQLVGENGELRNFVNIYLNQEDIRHLNGLSSNVEDASEIRIIPSIAGGTETDLSSQEYIRYSRHLTLPEVGVEGQKKLKNAKVLIVGAGGLGSPVSLYLAAAGIGTLGLVDFDVVDESNLQRQVLYGVDQLGKSKLTSARDRLNNLNPTIEIILHEVALTSENALDIIKDYDMVVDGTDNFPTRYLVNDACVLLGKPNVYGSIFRFEGQASVFNYADGPCYRCLYPEPPPPNLVPSCAEGGVLGVLPGIIGSIQANEAIKIALGVGDLLSNRFLLFDALEMKFTELKVRKNDNCAVCGKKPTVTELIDYHHFCGIPNASAKVSYNEITVQELESILNGHSNGVRLLDVREIFETSISQLPNAINIPKNEIPKRIDELNKENEWVVFCKSGIRSQEICEYLAENNFKSVSNLKGGINAWAREVDPSLPVY